MFIITLGGGGRANRWVIFFLVPKRGDHQKSHSFLSILLVGVPVITRLALNCEDVMIHMYQDFDLELIYLFSLRRPDPQTARSFLSTNTIPTLSFILNINFHYTHAHYVYNPAKCSLSLRFLVIPPKTGPTNRSPATTSARAIVSGIFYNNVKLITRLFFHESVSNSTMVAMFT